MANVTFPVCFTIAFVEITDIFAQTSALLTIMVEKNYLLVTQIIYNGQRN